MKVCPPPVENRTDPKITKVAIIVAEVPVIEPNIPRSEYTSVSRKF